MDLLLRKKRALTIAFREQDIENTEIVSKTKWAEIMQNITGLKILWLSIITSIVPVHALTENGILYMDFINNIRRSTHRDNSRAIFKNSQPNAPRKSVSAAATASSLMDALYGNKKRILEKIFYYFDTNNDGLIDRKEFQKGCAKLNSIGIKQAKDLTATKIIADSNSYDVKVIDIKPYQLTDVDDILDLMDFNHSGEVDINEFFESFRLVNLHSNTI